MIPPSSASWRRSFTPRHSLGSSVITASRRSPCAVQDADHVGEVVLVLRVVGRHLGQRGPEALRRRSSTRWCRSPGSPAAPPSRRAARRSPTGRPCSRDHAAVAGGIRDLRGEEGRGRAARHVVLDEAPQCGLGQQRHVAGQDQDGAGGVAAGHAGLQHRVPGAEPLLLLDEGGRGLGRDRRPDILRRPPDHDHHPGPEGPRGSDGIGDQRTAAERVKDLGSGRAHALGLSGGENDGGELIHGIDHVSTRHATRRGRATTRNGLF